MVKIKNPLGMPAGSVRAILAIFLVVSIIGAYIASIFAGFAFPGELLAVAGIIIGYYFKSREVDK